MNAKVSGAGNTRPTVLPKCFIMGVQKDEAALLNILHLYTIFGSFVSLLQPNYIFLHFKSVLTHIHSTEKRMNMEII